MVINGDRDFSWYWRRAHGCRGRPRRCGFKRDLAIVESPSWRRSRSRHDVFGQILDDVLEFRLFVRRISAEFIGGFWGLCNFRLRRDLALDLGSGFVQIRPGLHEDLPFGLRVGGGGLGGLRGHRRGRRGRCRRPASRTAAHASRRSVLFVKLDSLFSWRRKNRCCEKWQRFFTRSCFFNFELAHFEFDELLKVVKVFWRTEK